MEGSVLEEKSSFKMLGLTSFFKLDWGSYIISIVRSASKKSGALIRSIKFLSSEVALYLCKSTIWPCSWFYFHILEGGLLVILIDYIIFLSTFLDVTMISMSAVSFLVQLDVFLCL